MGYLNMQELEQWIGHPESYTLNRGQLTKIKESHDFLLEFSRNKVIYGINTGFGPMAPYFIEEKDQNALQYNLVRSHASGVGPGLSDDQVLAVMICRLHTLSLGYSGLSPEVAGQLEKFIQKGIYPYIPTHGSVGASGDLVQLAHLALALIGEGEGHYKGNKLPMNQILEQNGLSPVELKLRDGLALINGTSSMTGIGILNVIAARKLLSASIKLSAVLNEISESYSDSFSNELNEVKLHEGQQLVAGIMRKTLKDSKRIKNREDHLFKEKESIPNGFLNEKVQEYYSLRCVPQIIGPVYDLVESAAQCLEKEINSVNDNPVIDVKRKNVFHGGNFHGDYVALEMDKLKIGITKISMLMERQLNFLLNHRLNERFPPFLNAGKLGFNFGFQGIQYTATSTTAENQSLSNPVYVHSIPNNNDNQDIVSMGTNAALITQKVIDNSFQVCGVLAMAIGQSIELCGDLDSFGESAQDLLKGLRRHVRFISDDRSVSAELQNLITAIQEGELSVLTNH